MRAYFVKILILKYIILISKIIFFYLYWVGDWLADTSKTKA